MATTEQVTLTAQDLHAASTAIKHLEPREPVELSRANDHLTLTWDSNGTTGVVIHDGRVVDG